MMCSWIGIALLSGSWLLGLDYFYPASPWAWLATVAAAVVLLGKTEKPLAASQTRLEAAALVLMLPVVWCAAWPYRAAPLLIVLGLAIQLLPHGRRWADRLASGAIMAGVVMFAQALVLELYASHTAWSHDLPWPLPDALAGIAALLGIDAAADGSSVAMHSMRQVHRLGATWELLLDPATLLFYVGGLTMLALRRNDECGMMNDEFQADMPVVGCEESIQHSAFSLQHFPNWSAWIRGLRTLTLILLCWLPLRAGLLMAVYLQRVLRSDPDRPLHAMNHLFSPWMLLALLTVPVLLAWRFVRTGDGGRGAEEGNDECGMMNDELSTDVREDGGDVPIHHSSFIIHHFSPSLAPLLIALAVALFTAAIDWDPVGARRDGRVMVVERHSQWEPTTKPYDTKWFAEPRLFEQASGYNYAAIYDYLGQYYQMSRLLEKDKIDDQTLDKCDVLIIKTPTARYAPAEVEAVQRFVDQGGGLLLIGDHTNFERSSTIMNDITRPMGFIFRDDLLFGFGEQPEEQHYAPPARPHPIVQHVPPLDFAISCSIDPGHSHGRPVIASVGLWSMGPKYHHDNFMPFAQHCPEMRYGAFVQAWAARYGQGRAVAFTDSTIFSNFCAFQPGRAELMLGMVEWVNHGSPPLDPRPWLLLLGLPTLVAGLWMAWLRASRAAPPHCNGGAFDKNNNTSSTPPHGNGGAFDKNNSTSSTPPHGNGGAFDKNNSTSTTPLHCNGGAFDKNNSTSTTPPHGNGGAFDKNNSTSTTPPHCNGGDFVNRTHFVLFFLAAGGCGWVAASLGIAASHRWAMPAPECLRPLPRVVIDRTLSTVPLAEGLFTQGNNEGYGMLEAWIPRLDCYTAREEGADAFSGDALVVICPNRSVTAEFRQRLTRYVAEGGRLLVIDSPENAGSTANSLLWPFGLSIHHDRAWQGKLSTTGRLPVLDVAQAHEITGGQPLGKLDKLATIAAAKHGKGSVMAIGCGSLWNDRGMGETWMLEPDAKVKARYDVLFALLRAAFFDEPLPSSPPRPAKKTPAELPLKESGPADL